MKNILIILIAFSLGFAQNINSLLYDDVDDLKSNTKENIQQLDITDLQNLSYTPVENSINPNMYILGPGDLLGISIVSANNISLPIRVNPVGEVLIPSVGIINVDGKSLSEARVLIENHIHHNALPNSIVDVTLIDLKRFKIQLLGAVNNPGYVYVSSVDGIYETINNNGGVQKFADPDLVQIIRGEEVININLSSYLVENDQNQNMILQTGDIIYVPFSEYAKVNNLQNTSYNDIQVIVFGFVSRNSNGTVFRYLPGYTVRDYIALAGGTVGANSSFPIGNMKRSKIYRADGTNINNALDEVVLPGDIIEVPPKFISQLVGNDGLIRTIASVVSSAYLIYRYVQDQKN